MPPSVSDDLLLAHRMADAADLISAAHFRSAELEVERKSDGSPVTEVDRAVEAAMLALVRAERPGDGVLGEEAGTITGDNDRRWIFDGIDGTHNYAAGRAGWGTMLALEIAGRVELGVVTSPCDGIRYWAERGGGAWSAPLRHDGRRADGEALPGPANRLACSAAASLDGAKVIVSPPTGFLAGWRSDVAARFDPDQHPRKRSFAMDVCLAAAGEYDAIVLLAGDVWDFAANVPIAEEAGAVFVNAWGDQRLDTWSAIIGPAALATPLLDAISAARPGTPDQPVRLKPIPRD